MSWRCSPLQKANLATVHEAQTVLVRCAEAIAKLQYGYVEGAFDRRQGRSPEQGAAEGRDRQGYR